MLFFNSDCINIIWSRSRSSHKQTIITIHIHLKKNMLSGKGFSADTKQSLLRSSFLCFYYCRRFYLGFCILCKLLSISWTHFKQCLRSWFIFSSAVWLCVKKCSETNLLSKGSSINDVMQNCPPFLHWLHFLILRL
jgi:hypothetical protein